jgi:hypothetical protein
MRLLLLLITLIIAIYEPAIFGSNIVEEAKCEYHVKKPLSKSRLLDIDKKKDGKCELRRLENK